MKKMKKIAFSLAEVLLTMLVLGILISFTVPSLTLSYERNSTQAGFATIIKDVNKALFNYSVKKQCRGKLGCTNVFANANAAAALATEFSSVKTGTNCWNGKGSLNGFWLRRIDQEHRLVYTIDEEYIIIAQCGFHY